MSVILIEKKTNPLLVRFKIDHYIKEEPALFIWEDPFSKNIRHIDEISLNGNSEYYSAINKDISFFENGITFKIVSLKDYKCLYSYEFKNLNFISGKNILYISQNSYTGYSYAA